jgi:hypothetical protein
MAKHIIKGKTCKITLDIPAYWDSNTREVLDKILKYCIEEDKQKSVIDSIEILVEAENKLIEGLEATGNKNTEFEKKMREFIGMNLNHGFGIGSNYRLTNKAKMSMISQLLDYKKIIEGFPIEDMHWLSIFYGIYLGRLSYETGFMLGTSISSEVVEEYKEEIRREMSYVG